MDDPQYSTNQTAAADQDESYSAPQQANTQSDEPQKHQEQGWSASGEATDGSFVLGYN